MKNVTAIAFALGSLFAIACGGADPSSTSDNAPGDPATTVAPLRAAATRYMSDATAVHDQLLATVGSTNPETMDGANYLVSDAAAIESMVDQIEAILQSAVAAHDGATSTSRTANTSATGNTNSQNSSQNNQCGGMAMIGCMAAGTGGAPSNPSGGNGGDPGSILNQMLQMGMQLLNAVTGAQQQVHAADPKLNTDPIQSDLTNLNTLMNDPIYKQWEKYAGE